ncbi:MAG: glycogen/starch/alpha-glucan phosphorylase [Firmicutes bacterium]|nr:glycogen/starch/alpha-glucan phosphorylase [Bacillota bacterium]
MVTNEIFDVNENNIDADALKDIIVNKINRYFGNAVEEATCEELYQAIARSVRDFIAEKWIKTKEVYGKQDVKQVYYLSMEFLVGRLLGNNIMNLGLVDVYEKTAKELGINLNDIRDVEKDAGLGSGGMGRLAACFLDSLATLQLPGHGYGMRYRYGMFEQKIIDGSQFEFADNWLESAAIWEFRDSDDIVQVRFGGNVRYVEKEEGGYAYVHENYYTVNAVPYDVPVMGYRNNTVNTLRLWYAEALNKFDFDSFTKGRFMNALKEKNNAEQISLVLYPDDSHYEGKVLRLKQQYFFVSASIQDIVRKFKKQHNDLKIFSDKVVMQLNDTHPSVAIPEMIRILIDEEELSWDEAWDIVTGTFAFTNHTILPEALEEWAIDIMQGLFPRVYQIIEEIDRRWIESLGQKYPDRPELVEELRIIKDGKVRMTHLCIVGSYSVNGVAELHSEILKKVVFKHFYQIFPKKFNNKTNGITPRRWLVKANPELADAIVEKIGSQWITDLEQLKRLEQFADDKAFQEKVHAARRNKKVQLADYILDNNHIQVDVDSIFVIQCKRMHEYKRQLLNVLHIMYLYNYIKDNPHEDIISKTFIFSGKAAPNYYMAKLVIKLINNVAALVNHDPVVNKKLKVVFLENFRVSLAEKLYPAADVSVQISTASKEASGTGNMKFMLNGALTIGTMDGANVEIAREVGKENIYIFGLRSDEVMEYYRSGGYNSQIVINNNRHLERIMKQLIDGTVSPENHDLFRDIYNHLMYAQNGGLPDPYFNIKDFEDYVDKHHAIDRDYRNAPLWLRKSIINIANSGKFSSDRSMQEYAQDIWHIHEVRMK